MEKNRKSENSAAQEKKLEWGDHNQQLTDDNFIDRKRKKISDQNELLAGSNAPIESQDEEPNRDRKGVKEGRNALDLDDKRGKVF
jgi:hypothetical protein